MKLRALICVALLVLAAGLAGQTGMISSGNDMITFMNSDLDYIKNNKERYAKIEGSAYLNEAFHNGSVSYKHKKYMGLKLRHNPYKGYFEFQTEEGIKFFDPRITPIDTVWLDKETFLYVLYLTGKNMKRDYMRLMNQGSTMVLQFSQIILIQPEAANGYEEAKPARFEKRSDAIYILTGDQPAMEFKGKKSLPEIFPEHLETLSGYVKTEKMKLKKTSEIINLCAYYDTIR
jgi:hypothetical protein